MSGFFAPEDFPTVIDADTDLLTAQAAAVDGFPVADPPGTEDRPIGRTWAIDWKSGGFRMRGSDAVEVTDHEALGVWIETALRVGRYAYGIFSDAYGIENVDAPVGEIVVEAHLTDLAGRIRRALMIHDRIRSVENVVLAVDGDAVYVRSMEVVMDETNRLSVTDVKVGG